jgi:hypothetical protein
MADDGWDDLDERIVRLPGVPNVPLTPEQLELHDLAGPPKDLWATVYLSYVTGGRTLDEVAAAYGLSPAHVRMRAGREGWKSDQAIHQRNVLANAQGVVLRDQGQRLAETMEPIPLLARDALDKAHRALATVRLETAADIAGLARAVAPLLKLYTDFVQATTMDRQATQRLATAEGAEQSLGRIEEMTRLLRERQQRALAAPAASHGEHEESQP